jgi:uncharacterized damage-inducible protein DinB
MSKQLRSDCEIRDVLLEIYSANERMNQLLLEHINPRAWRAQPPMPKDGRTISAIFAHMHNNRLVWLKRSAPHLRCPKRLDPERCTARQAAVAHQRSSARCLEMLAQALLGDPRRVTTFSRGSWASPWPAGATMFAYMFAHDAHHRGQVIALAHQLGYRLPESAANGIWQWESFWSKLGFARGPR